MKHLIYDQYKDMLCQLEGLKDCTSKAKLISFISTLLYEEKYNNYNIDKFVEDIYTESISLNSKLVRKYAISNDALDIKKSIPKLLEDFTRKEQINIRTIAYNLVELFDMIGFIEVNPINNKLTLIDGSLLLKTYYDTKSYVENITNDSFVSDFNTVLHKITDENVKYINKQLSITEKKNIEDEVVEYLSIETLQDIKYAAYAIQQLKDNGITTSNYSTKIAAYENFVDKAFDDFGVSLNRSLPYSNPSSIYADIDYLLSRSGLNNEQKKRFYNELNIREKIPKATQTKAHFESEDDANILRKFQQLASLEQDSFIHDEEFDYSEQLSDLISEVGIEKLKDITSELYTPSHSDPTIREYIVKEHKRKVRETSALLQSHFYQYPTFKLTIPQLLKIDNFNWH